jgi:hypothetical protein
VRCEDNHNVLRKALMAYALRLFGPHYRTVKQHRAVEQGGATGMMPNGLSFLPAEDIPRKDKGTGPEQEVGRLFGKRRGAHFWGILDVHFSVGRGFSCGGYWGLWPLWGPEGAAKSRKKSTKGDQKLQKGDRKLNKRDQKSREVEGKSRLVGGKRGAKRQHPFMELTKNAIGGGAEKHGGRRMTLP